MINIVGISVRVIDIFSLKPLDNAGLIENIAQCSGKVVVAEEHYPEGGLYEAVCGAALGSIKMIRHLCVHRVPGSAKPQEQLEIHGLDNKAI
jgi:transketolase